MRGRQALLSVGELETTGAPRSEGVYPLQQVGSRSGAFSRGRRRRQRLGLPTLPDNQRAGGLRHEGDAARDKGSVGRRVGVGQAFRIEYTGRYLAERPHAFRDHSNGCWHPDSLERRPRCSGTHTFLATGPGIPGRLDDAARWRDARPPARRPIAAPAGFGPESSAPTAHSCA